MEEKEFLIFQKEGFEWDGFKREIHKMLDETDQYNPLHVLKTLHVLQEMIFFVKDDIEKELTVNAFGVDATEEYIKAIKE